MSGFAVVAVIGMKRHLWLVAIAFAAHAVLDFFHGDLVNNPGVPEWWPAFCLAFGCCSGRFDAHDSETSPVRQFRRTQQINDRSGGMRSTKQFFHDARHVQ